MHPVKRARLFPCGMDVLCVPAVAAPPFPHREAGDLQQPLAESPAIVHALELGVRPNECLLHGVLAVGDGRAGPAPAEGKHHCRVPVVEPGKRVLVAGLQGRKVGAIVSHHGGMAAHGGRSTKLVDVRSILAAQLAGSMARRALGQSKIMSSAPKLGATFLVIACA